MSLRKTNSSETVSEINASPSLIALLAFSAGAIVANLYYNQPLLEMIGKDFDATATATGSLNIATQLGYAAGLLFILPLADSLERRKLILTTVVAAALALLGSALAPSLSILIAAGFLLGFVSVTPQLLVPFAAGITEPRKRGRIIGIVMSGLLVGILASRSLSGYLGAYIGWKGVYFCAAAAMVILAVVLRFKLPSQKPKQKIRYRTLLASLVPILKRQPVLRRHMLIGAAGFGAFSAFWTTLAFYLYSRPEQFDSRVVGLFGLIGMIGALVAPISGRLSDRFSARVVNGISLILALIAFILMGLADMSFFLLIIGVFLMDAGVQGSQISNQSRIYALSSKLRNRINSLYMVAYFLGGALGSGIGSWSWQHFGWTGVCSTGAAFCAVGLSALFFRNPSRTVASAQ